jgi:hypothetical protein
MCREQSAAAPCNAATDSHLQEPLIANGPSSEHIELGKGMEINPKSALLALAIATFATGCDEITDHDTPGYQRSEDLPHRDTIDGRQEKVIPGSRNDGAVTRD